MSQSPHLIELLNKTVTLELVTGRTIGGKLVAVDDVCVKLEHLNFKGPALVMLSSIVWISESKEDAN